MNKTMRVIHRSCPCGSTVRAVVIYEINKRGIRISDKREIG
jgi:hypothetical protein